MVFYIATIVEGQTETLCVERLLHQIFEGRLAPTDRCQVLSRQA